MTMLLFPISIANIICKSSVSLTGQVVIEKILPARTAHAQHFDEHLAHRGGDDSGDNRLGDAVCSDDAQNRLVDQVGGNLFGGAPSLPEQQVDEIHHQQGVGHRAEKARNAKRHDVAAMQLLEAPIDKVREDAHQNTWYKADHQAPQAAAGAVQRIKWGKDKGGKAWCNGVDDQTGQSKDAAQHGACLPSE